MSNTNVPAFAPGGDTVKIDATNTTANVQVQEAHNSRHVRVHNYGPDPVWIAFGDVAVEADVTTSMPMPAGSVEVFTCPSLYVAAVTSGADIAAVYITPGEGL